MALCILKEHANKLKAKLLSGEIRVEDLYVMDSGTRRARLNEFLPDGVAKQVNADFESKLVLKNQQRGLQNWLNKQVDMPEPTKRDLFTKVQRMSKVLDASDTDDFLADLAETKLGARVTVEQANELSRLAKNVEAAPKNTMEYGYARADFDQYLEDLINPANKSGLRDNLKGIAKDVKANPLSAFSHLGGISKSIKAALDNSALLRQGLKTLVTNPKQWSKNALKSFGYMTDTFGGKNVMREIRASMYMDPDFDLAVKAKLAIGVDDAIPTSIQEKIPLFGRFFAASDNAFRGFLFKTRFDVFKKYVQLAKDAGIDTTDKQFIEQIGSMVNSQTGRGRVAFGGEKIANELNNLFFSPRFLASQLDTFLHPITGARGGAGLTDFTKETRFIRKQAFLSLVKMIGAIGGVMAISNALHPGSAETDPRSSNFGKIKIGNTRIDYTGGLASLIVLMARTKTGESKSATTGKITKLNDPEAYKGKTTGDVWQNFILNKLSPIASVANESVFKKRTFDGSKPTVANQLKNLLMPLPISNFLNNANDPKAAPLLATTILDFLGASTSTYGNEDFKKK